MSHQSSVPFYILHLLILFTYASAPASSTPALIPISSFPLIYNSSHLSTLPINRDVVTCVDDSSWNNPPPHEFRREACLQPLSEIDSISRQFGNKYFEFVFRDSTPLGPTSPIKTPDRFYYRNCEIAIVMFKSFPESQFVPGLPPGPHPVRTWARYKDILIAAENIHINCVSGRNIRPGWQAVGDGTAMGVFLWGSVCPIDRLL